MEAVSSLQSDRSQAPAKGAMVPRDGARGFTVLKIDE